MQNARHMTGEKQISELQQVEMNKTSDSLRVDYGFKLIDLLRTVQKLKLEENVHIKSFKKMFEMQKLTEAKARAAKAAPPAELVNRLLAEVNTLGSA